MPSYVIIGGGLASASAAKGVRAVDPNGPITIVSMEQDPPYNRPDLTKTYLRGETERTASYVEPESWYAEHGVVLRLGTRVASLDRASQRVVIEGGEPIPYDRLLIATGARIRRLELPGSDLKGINYIRIFQHADAVRNAAVPGTHAVIVGGSFIATEVAASLRMKGVEVDVLNMDPNLYGRILGPEVGGAVERVLTNRGVRVHNNTRVAAFEGENGRATVVVDATGKRWPADIIVVGAGVLPNDELARQAGLKVDNGVVVDDYLQTSDPVIWAAGDVARWTSPLYPQGIRVEHWDVAYNSGEVAGKDMAGEHVPYDGMPFVFSDIGDVTMDVIGYASEWDEVVWRDLGDEQFGAAYLKDGRVVQGATIGDEEFVNGLGDLIRARKDVSGLKAKLADPSVKVQELV